MWAVPLILLVAAAAVSTQAYVFPREDGIRPVDAVVVLGGLNSGPLLREAVALADEGYTDRIVISDAFGGDTRPANLCERESDHEIECFRPDPGSTRGEAQAIAALADERGWRSVAVVTATYHVSRARVLIERCYPGDLAMVGAAVPMGVGDWAHQYAYQSAGFVKVWLNPGC